MLREKIWMNGRYLDSAEGVINISTSTIHYGTSVFEGILCIMIKERGAIFRLQDHIDRLFESCAALNFKVTYSKEELCDVIINLVKIDGCSSCYIRPIIFSNTNYLNFKLKEDRLNVVILYKKFNNQIYQLQMRKKIKVIVSKRTRNLWTDNLAKVKISGKYMNSVMAKIEAKKDGCDDAILLSEGEIVSEATSSNIFIVRDGIVKTPPYSKALSGITQNSVMQIGRDLGFTVIEQDISLEELYSAEEVFLTNTAKGIISVSQVNSRRILDLSRRRITEVLRNKYIDIIKGKDQKYQEWLTYV